MLLDFRKNRVCVYWENKWKINGQEEFFQSSLAVWVHGNHYYYCCYGYHRMGYVFDSVGSSMCNKYALTSATRKYLVQNINSHDAPLDLCL